MPHSVYFQHTENDGACLELLTRRESEWRKNHGASRVPPAHGKVRRACLELLTRSESNGEGLSNPPSQGLLQSSSHTCGYTSLPNMAPIIDTSGVSIVVTVQEIPHSNI